MDKREPKNGQEKADWQWLLSDPRGRRVVAFLIEAGTPEDTVFNGNSRDVFVEGRRSIGREVIRRAKEASFDNYLLMQKEQHNG